MLALFRWPLAGLCLFLAQACGSTEKTKAAEPSARVEAPYEEAQIDSTTGVASLSGSWTASAYLNGYGTANAVVLLNAKGEGSYSGSLSGIPQSGLLRVVFWDGEWLLAESEGYQKRVRGSLSGDELRLELPSVGSVVFQRASR